MTSVVIDNVSLLRGILTDPPQHATLQKYLLESKDFQILLNNEMLRSRLRLFLELDYEVVRARRELDEFPLISLLIGRKERARMKERLAQLLEDRAKAFNEYEMLRRLVCYDNDLLAVHPS